MSIVADAPGVPQAIHLLQGCLGVFAAGGEVIAELGERETALLVDEPERGAHDAVPGSWVEVDAVGDPGDFAKMLQRREGLWIEAKLVRSGWRKRLGAECGNERVSFRSPCRIELH